MEVGGARLVRDHELTASVMASHIREMCSSEEIRGEMRRQSRTLGRKDAARKVVDLAVSMLRARGKNV